MAWAKAASLSRPARSVRLIALFSGESPRPSEHPNDAVHRAREYQQGSFVTLGQIAKKVACFAHYDPLQYFPPRELRVADPYLALLSDTKAVF